MSTTIEWTQRPGTKGETWNPTTGCNKVSQGCKNCYAEVMHKRLQKMSPAKYSHPFLGGAVPHLDALTIPLKWKRPRTVFVNSMSDLFHEAVPFAFIDQVFAVMALTPQHTYQILTKRPERMAEYLMERDPLFLTDRSMAIGQQMNALRGLRVDEAVAAVLPLPNVWLGTSVEDQATADARIPHLLRCPAAVRFLSCEPLLGPVDFAQWMLVQGGRTVDPRDTEVVMPGIHWVITGGESGPKARPMHPDWARGLREQCNAAGVPLFFKQWGAWSPTYQHTMLFSGHGGELVCYETISSTDRKAIGSMSYHAYPVVYTAGPARVEVMRKSNKHASGNVLDGATHQEWPVPTA